MRTYSIRPQDVHKEWFVVDAEGKTLGRLATEVARVLTGKHKPIFTSHIDVGDFVVVVNAAKVVLTGNKLAQKTYKHHSMHPGGFKEKTAKLVMETRPELVVESAVKGMLPNNRLRPIRMQKLKVFAGPTHTHEAQKPKVLEV